MNLDLDVQQLLLGQFIFLETQEVNGIDSSIPLEKFPTKLSLANHQYTLRGIVYFIEPPRRRSSDINLIGHYVTICLAKPVSESNTMT